MVTITFLVLKEDCLIHITSLQREVEVLALLLITAV